MFLLLRKMTDVQRQLHIYSSLCHCGLISNRMRHAFEFCFGAIVRTRAYALMALGSNNKDMLPSVWNIRLLDGGLISALFVSTTLICKNSIWACIIMAVYLFFVYFIFAFFIDFGKSGTRYYIRFGKLPDRTRLKWKVGVWTVVILLYLYAFTILCFQTYS